MKISASWVSDLVSGCEKYEILQTQSSDFSSFSHIKLLLYGGQNFSEDDEGKEIDSKIFIPSH